MINIPEESRESKILRRLHIKTMLMKKSVIGHDKDGESFGVHYKRVSIIND